MRSMLSQDARTGCAEASQKIEGQRRGQATALAGDGLVRRNRERGQGRGGLVGEAIGVSPDNHAQPNRLRAQNSKEG